jgi:hypothetical protein
VRGLEATSGARPRGPQRPTEVASVQGRSYASFRASLIVLVKRSFPLEKLVPRVRTPSWPSREGINYGTSPSRIFASLALSMLPPETTQTIFPLPALPVSAAATEAAPAPSAITRCLSASSFTAAAIS